MISFVNTFTSKFFLNFKPFLLSVINFRNVWPVNWKRWNKNYLLDIFSNHLIYYPTPISITYAWSFGALAGICLIIQMLSGIFLAMHYTPDTTLAFSSVEYIMRDVENGWFIRYIHANGASMFFIAVYSHIFRGLYYGSYMSPRELLWCSGVLIFFLMILTAFTGYVLPWGQMSFWGATVITSMVTIIPVAGQAIAEWLWGGYVVNSPTLHRFFSVHFCLPFILAGLSLIHIALLHKEGSNNPIGSDSGIDDIPFYPYAFVKDLFVFTVFLFVFAFFVFYYPNVLNHPDNCIPANPLKTPLHVVPEWYLLPFYAILRSIPHKTAGILTMGGSIAVLALIPFINSSETRNTTYRPMFKIFYWLLVSDFILLMWIGQKPVENIYTLAGQILTVYYFVFFLIVVGLVGKIESKLVYYNNQQN